MRNTAAVLLLIVQIVGSVPDCAVQLCTPKEWCRYCIKVRNGPGYYEDPTSCSHFYLCSGTKDYADALRARCPPCQYWNQNLLTCVPLRSANCPKGTTPANREPYPDPRYCSHYYQCTNDGYTTECCKRPNNYFNPNTLACEPNPACNDYCDKVVTTTIPSTTRKPSGPTCRHSSGWYYERDPVNLSTYYLLVGGNRHITYSCAPDIFNLVTCSCPVKTTPTVTTRKTTTPTVTTLKTTTPTLTTRKTTTPSTTTTRQPLGPTCKRYGLTYEQDPNNPSVYYLLAPNGKRIASYSCAPDTFDLTTCTCASKTTPAVTTPKTTTTTARPDHRCLLLHAKLMSDFRDEKNNYINPGTVYIDSAVHAAKFEAKITDTLEIPRFNNYDFSSGFTISVWFKLDPSRANLFSGIVSNGDCTGDGTVNIWYDNKSVNAAVCGMNTKVSIPIEAGKWYQVVLTYDGETMTLYVNGAGKSLMCKAVPPDLRKHAPFSFGYNFCGKGGFSGYMFDIHIYSCSLTPAEVGKLYNYGKKLVP